VRPEPVRLTLAPIAAAGGDKVPIAGLLTVNTTLELLATEPTTTVTGPVVTLLGAVAVIDVLLHELTAAGTPLKFTLLLP
jgi:hypothetical protein